MTTVSPRAPGEPLSSRTDRGDHRLESLDGLRGVCAVVVLIGHGLLVAPVLSDAVVRGAPLERGSWQWWLTNTPLHLAWAGSEAVLVFFVMSGFVLTLPLARLTHATAPRWSWASYYPRRMVRLYLPLAAAALFSWVLVSVQSREPVSTASEFTNANQSSFSPLEVFRDIVVIAGVDTLNGAFWSLQWEVLFSLLLPAFAVLLLVRRRPALLLVGFLVAVPAGAAVVGEVVALPLVVTGALTYFPVFALGVVMAANWGYVVGAGRWLDGAAGIVKIVCWGGPLLLLVLPWVGPEVLSTSAIGRAVATSVQTFAAAGIVALVAATHAGRRYLTGSVVSWLGSRSFSLYLTHSPIVITTTFALGGTPNAGLVLAVAGPLALLAAEGFYRCVERPAIVLSRHVGTSTQRLVRKGRAGAGLR